MKGQDLFNGMTFIEEEIIEEAGGMSTNKSKVIPWKRFGVAVAGACAAACLVVVSWNVMNRGKDTPKGYGNESSIMANTSGVATEKPSVTTENQTVPEIEITYVEKNDMLVVAAPATSTEGKTSEDIRDIVVEAIGNSDQASSPKAGEVTLSKSLIYARLQIYEEYYDDYPDDIKEVRYLVNFHFGKYRDDENDHISGEELRKLYEKYDAMGEYELIWVEGGKEFTFYGSTYKSGNALYGLLTEEQLNNFVVEEPYSCVFFLTDYEYIEQWLND